VEGGEMYRQEALPRGRGADHRVHLGGEDPRFGVLIAS
jgi:hypothetical protein